MPLTQPQLDIYAASGCQTPGCKHAHEKQIVLAALCCPGAGVRVTYETGGVLLLDCHRCHRRITEVAVASSLKTER
ncbi:MAG: hypothetical protein ABIS50_11380 [Luteolibacter sp.]|uniref:hypothetical protein n=1 Tax=Luteolibacter sp. TaxID=1962973 RepID=UPI0032668A54